MAAASPSPASPGIQNILHFMPGELVFRVDHDEELDTDGIRRQLAGQRELGEDGELQSILRDSAENTVRVLTFDRGEPAGFQGVLWRRVGLVFSRQPRFFSLVFVTLPGDRYGYRGELPISAEQHNALLDKLLPIDSRIARRRPRRPISPRFSPPEGNAARPLSSVKRFARAITSQPVFELHAAAFNWMSSSAQGQAVPTGGPGTYAVADRTGTPGNGIAVSNLPESQQALRPVEVFVLDTIPRYDKSWILSQSLPQTPLVAWLTSGSAPGDKLTIRPDDTPLPPELRRNMAEAARLMDWLNHPVWGVEICEYRCDMSAHGLFVADIICGVMGQTTDYLSHIHLYEVLNQWGVGTVETVARGLMAVIQQVKPGTRAVVNCSFAILIPRLGSEHNKRVGHRLPGETECERDSRLHYDARFRDNLRALLRGGGEARMRAMLEPIFDLLEQKGVVCVAAAGNEWNNTSGSHASSSRPVARYPAAFGSVIGVAALDERSHGPGKPKLAPYSNRADEPASAGFATFGGGVGAGPAVGGKLPADATNSIQGLYIGDFCDGSPNTTWLAYWSGTSFAAPIITGALAARRAGGNNPVDAISSLRRLSLDTTDEQEDVVWVQ
ncbi:MAG: S8/S53 family peptidase [Chloroflexi bacterium]|nr:S8/S53 family peptidase [Chloroflexota bacterium]